VSARARARQKFHSDFIIRFFKLSQERMTSKSIRLGAAQHRGREREEEEGRRGEAFERASFNFDVSPDDLRDENTSASAQIRYYNESARRTEPESQCDENKMDKGFIAIHPVRSPCRKSVTLMSQERGAIIVSFDYRFLGCGFYY